MLEKYNEELKLLKAKMLKAEEFSKKLPLFSTKIINEKLTADMNWIQFGNYYKTLSCGWGINRGLYTKGTNRDVTNYVSDDHYSAHLFSIYINTLSIYDSHNKYGLESIKDNITLFYYDALNSTFYVADEHIEALLDALVEWEGAACIKAAEDGKQAKIYALQNKINQLKCPTCIRT